MKKLGMLLLFLGLSCFTVGCGGGDTTPSTSSEPAATTPADDTGTGTESTPAEGGSGTSTTEDTSGG